MKEEVAAEASKRLWKIHGELNDLVWVLKERCEDDEFRTFRRRVAAAMAAVGDVMTAIYREFPNLEPKTPDDIEKFL